jgi:hypothetical protein
MWLLAREHKKREARFGNKSAPDGAAAASA